MIRQASKFDMDAIIELLRKYQKNSPLDALRYADDEEYIRKLLTELLSGMGFVFLAEKDNVIIGMLIAAIVPNIWNPKAKQCSEVAYWVDPEFRGGSAAYRLITAYVKECEEMTRQGKINFFTVTKMVNSPDLKYNKFGFNKLEETWFK
jgi:N-acetylglutamate synthase-like GNAT family acetyltransferase